MAPAQIEVRSRFPTITERTIVAALNMEEQDEEHGIQVTTMQVQAMIDDQARQEAQDKAQLYQQECKVAADARQLAEVRAADAEGEVESLRRRVTLL